MANAEAEAPLASPASCDSLASPTPQHAEAFGEPGHNLPPKDPVQPIQLSPRVTKGESGSLVQPTDEKLPQGAYRFSILALSCTDGSAGKVSISAKALPEDTLPASTRGSTLAQLKSTLNHVDSSLFLAWDEVFVTDVREFEITANVRREDGAGEEEEDTAARDKQEEGSPTSTRVTIKSLAHGKQIALAVPFRLSNSASMNLIGLVEAHGPPKEPPSPSLMIMQVEARTSALPLAPAAAWLYLSPEDDTPGVVRISDDLLEPSSSNAAGQMRRLSARRRCTFSFLLPSSATMLFVKLLSVDASERFAVLASSSVEVTTTQPRNHTLRLSTGDNKPVQLSISLRPQPTPQPAHSQQDPRPSDHQISPHSFSDDPASSSITTTLVRAPSPTEITALQSEADRLRRETTESARKLAEMNIKIDDRDAAIRKLGHVVAQLRKSNAALEEDKRVLQHRLALRERELELEAEVAMANGKPENDDPSSVANVEELREQLRVLSRRYRSERETNRTVLQRLEAVSLASRKMQQERDFVENLERAHREQARYIQHLQAELPKVKIYKKTIKRQEENIAKLQQILEAHVAGRFQRGRPNLRVSTTGASVSFKSGEGGRRESNGSARSEGRRRTEDMSGVQGFLGDLQDDGAIDDDASDIAKDNDERVEALEDKLVENAKVFAKQIAALKMKLLQYEAKMGALEDNEDDLPP